MSLISQNQQSTSLIQFQDSPLSSGERFLEFPLNSKVNSLLSLSNLQGTIKVTVREILPVPNVAEYWLGIINWRGEAIWILDLAGFLGDTHWCRQQSISPQGMAILVQVKNQAIGLLVRQVNTIESYRREELLPMIESMIPQQQQQFFQGYFLNSEGEPLMLLNIPQLVEALA